MAKVYAPPEGLDPPNIREFDFDAYFKAVEKYVQEVSDFCKEKSNCPHAGKEIKFPMGDGYARYVIYNYTSLIHLAVGDSYSIDEAHARGLRKADIIRIADRKSLREILGGRR